MRRNPSLVLLTAVSLVCVLILAACNCAPTLRYITVSPTSALIDACTTQQLTLTAYYSDGTTKVGAATGLYTSSNPAVATVDSTGVVHALTAGTTTITVAASGTSGASATINVQQLKNLTISPLNSTVAAEGTKQFTASGVYINPDGSVNEGTSDVTSITTWTSSNTEAATIDNTGLATGVGNGTATITASVDCLTASTTLTVGPGTPVPVSLLVTPGSSTIAVGNATPLTVQEKWSDNSLHNPSGTVVWSSSAAGTAGVVSAIAPTPLYDGIAAGVAAGTATITATEGTLTGTAPLTVVTGKTYFAWVSNRTSGTSEGYIVDATTSPYLSSPGTLTIGIPEESFLNPLGTYQYQLDGTSHLWIFAIDSTGNRTLAPGITNPVAVVGGPGISGFIGTTDPYGRFIYVADPVDSAIYAYTVNATTGALTLVTGAPFSGASFNLSTPTDIVVDRTGLYAYVVNNGSGMISAYSINQTTGALSNLSGTPTIATGSSPTFAATDPAGKYLYVANSGAGSVTAYSITAGVLANISNLTVSGAVSVFNVSVSPSGNYLVVLDQGNASSSVKGQIYAYALTAGVPSATAATGTPIPTGFGPTNICVDPTSTLVAVPNSADGPPGTITIITFAGSSYTVQPSVATGTTPRWLVFYNKP